MSKSKSKMKAAAEYVRSHPGCTKLAAAEAVGPHGSRRYGYRSVDRAIRAGLIRVVGRRGNAYVLEVGS